MKNKIIESEFFWFSVLLILLPLIIVSLFLLTFNSNTTVFVGTQNYLRLFLKDDIFLTALKNTYLYAILAVLFTIVSVRMLVTVLKQKSFYLKFIIVALYVLISLLFIGAYIGFSASGDFYDSINRFLINIKFIDQPLYCFNSSLTMMLSILYIFISLIGVLLAAYTIRDFVKNNNLKKAIFYGMVIFSVLLAFQMNGGFTSLVGFPSSSYTAHTITTHITDYSAVRIGYFSSINIIFYLIQLEISLLFCLIIGLLDKIIEKIHSSKTRPDSIPN